MQAQHLETEQQPAATVTFEKVLTSSDISSRRRVVVPKAHAEQYLPPCRTPDGVSFSACEPDGTPYQLRLRYWVNCSSRMYLLEGLQTLHDRHDLQAGDVVVFARQPDGTWQISARKGTTEEIAKRRSRRATGSELVDAPTGLSLQTPCRDGVFRAMPDGHASHAAGKVMVQSGHWTAIVNVGGELYQAFFESQEAATVAYIAAAGAEAA